MVSVAIRKRGTTRAYPVEPVRDVEELAEIQEIGKGRCGDVGKICFAKPDLSSLVKSADPEITNGQSI